MTVYVIVQLKMTDRAAYDRYQARFFDVFRKFSGRLLSADEHPAVLEGAWNRDKLVLMSFPDAAAFRAWADSRSISKSRRTAKPAPTESCCWQRGFRRKALKRRPGTGSNGLKKSRPAAKRACFIFQTRLWPKPSHQ